MTSLNEQQMTLINTAANMFSPFERPMFLRAIDAVGFTAADEVGE
jgi:hypothetical protein